MYIITTQIPSVHPCVNYGYLKGFSRTPDFNLINSLILLNLELVLDEFTIIRLFKYCKTQAHITECKQTTVVSVKSDRRKPFHLSSFDCSFVRSLQKV